MLLLFFLGCTNQDGASDFPIPPSGLQAEPNAALSVPTIIPQKIGYPEKESFPTAQATYNGEVDSFEERSPTPSATVEVVAKVDDPVPAAPEPGPKSNLSLSIEGAYPQFLSNRLSWQGELPFELVYGDNAPGDVILKRSQNSGVNADVELVYAIVARFPTVRDEISFGELAQLNLIGSADTANLWGSTFPNLQVSENIEEGVWADPNLFALVPFNQLTPKLKVIGVDGMSPIDQNFNISAYPLVYRLTAFGEPAALAAYRDAFGRLTNRDPNKMTRIALTGVTALVRATAAQMEYAGVLFPGEVVAPILQTADIAHISNEVPFAPNCPFPNAVSQSMTFCSRDAYFQLLQHLGTDVVELTGNHANDYGHEALLHTLDMYRSANMLYYGGGINQQEGIHPIFFYDKGNKIAFVGCNPYGPQYAWAGVNSPGAANCGDYSEIAATISKLRGEGYIVIATLQYEEIYYYAPTASQKRDFGILANAGATIVSGSQAHHPQGFGFENDAFIHYGLGNLFFDQMFRLETRQTFIDQYVVYEGRLISVDLWTGLIEQYARPREMTPQERANLLNAVFRASGW